MSLIQYNTIDFSFIPNTNNITRPLKTILNMAFTGFELDIIYRLPNPIKQATIAPLLNISINGSIDKNIYRLSFFLEYAELDDNTQ